MKVLSTKDIKEKGQKKLQLLLARTCWGSLDIIFTEVTHEEKEIFWEKVTFLKVLDSKDGRTVRRKQRNCPRRMSNKKCFRTSEGVRKLEKQWRPI